MWKIADVEIKNQVVVAPMAGISNSAFRKIAKEMGSGLTYCEMVSDKGLFYNNEKTKQMLYMEDIERPLVQQIFGSNKETFVEAAKYIYNNMKPDIIDINMGCPVPKVALRSQAGSALLKDINKIQQIVTEVVKSVPIPITVKIRSGWDENNINAVEVAKVCEKSGASAICIHPRTRNQGYSGHSNWDIIKKVKESVSIPVIGNGDIKNIYDAKRMIEETGCDAIMIGRGVLGNPWLIKQIDYYLNNNEILEKPTKEERIDMCIKHFKYLLDIKPERISILEIRNHINWYLKGIKGGNEVKKNIFCCKNKNEIMKLLNEFRKENENESRNV